MSATASPPRPPVRQIIIYAIGQLGWSLAVYGVANLLVYFYLPPENAAGRPVFPAFVYQGALLGFGTLIGLITFGGRLLDAITDPLIAGWSDRITARMGKRKFLMAIAAFPLALLSFLAFFPLQAGATTTNVLWLVSIVVLFYIFFTLYMVPYTALISELGHHPDDRLKISTYIAISWALGFLIASNIYGMQALLEAHYHSVQAFQLAMAGISLLSFIALLVPVLFLQENRYALQQTSQASAYTSLRAVWSYRPFRLFLLSDIMYWLSLSFIQVGVSYYIMVLMGLPKSYASLFMVIAFLTSLACYALVNYLVPRYGKKPLVLFSFLVLAAIFALTTLSPFLPGRPVFYFLAVASGFPMAVFSIVPNALIADMIHVYRHRTGQQLSAMFFGVRNFGMKFGMSLANLIFPSLLLLGKSTDQPLGVQVAAGLAVLFCLLGFFLFRYVEIPTEE